MRLYFLLLAVVVKQVDASRMFDAHFFDKESFIHPLPGDMDETAQVFASSTSLKTQSRRDLESTDGRKVKNVSVKRQTKVISDDKAKVDGTSVLHIHHQFPHSTTFQAIADSDPCQAEDTSTDRIFGAWFHRWNEKGNHVKSQSLNNS